MKNLEIDSSASGVDRRRFLETLAAAAGVAAVGTSNVASSAEPAGAAPGATAAPREDVPAPLREVEGKVAFITGGTSGIGLGMARAFSAAGMKVVIGYIRDDQLQSALAQFPAQNPGVHAIKVDVTDREAMAAAAAETVSKFGRIHLLCNNAGVGVSAGLSAATYKDWDFAVGVNLTGVFNGIQTFLPRIREHGEGGHVMSTSSMNGLMPLPGGGSGVYTATKFAVVGLMESLRGELEAQKANIGASVFCPGLVNTNIFEVDKNRPAALANDANADPAAKAAAAARSERVRTSLMPAGMDPLEAGRRVLRGIRRNDLYILSHVEFGPGIGERHEAIMASVPQGETAPASRLAVENAALRNPLYERETRRLRRSPVKGPLA